MMMKTDDDDCGSMSSQSNPCYHSCWIPIFALIMNGAANPTGSKICATVLKIFLFVIFWSVKLGSFVVFSKF